MPVALSADYQQNLETFRNMVDAVGTPGQDVHDFAIELSKQAKNQHTREGDLTSIVLDNTAKSLENGEYNKGGTSSAFADARRGEYKPDSVAANEGVIKFDLYNHKVQDAKNNIEAYKKQTGSVPEWMSNDLKFEESLAKLEKDIKADGTSAKTILEDCEAVEAAAKTTSSPAGQACAAAAADIRQSINNKDNTYNREASVARLEKAKSGDATPISVEEKSKKIDQQFKTGKTQDATNNLDALLKELQAQKGQST